MHHFSNHLKIPEGMKRSEEKNELYQEEKKKQLIEKMRQKQHTREKKKKTNPEKKADTSQRTVRLHNEIDQLKRELRQAKKLLAAERKKKRDYKKQASHLAQELHQQQQTAKKEKQRVIQATEKQLNHTKALLDALEKAGWDKKNHALNELKIRNQLIYFLLQKRIQTKYYLDQQHREISQLTNRTNQLTQEADHLAAKNINYRKRLVKKEHEYEKLLRINQKQRELLSKRRQDFGLAEPHELISALIQQLDKKHFSAFNQLNKLFNRYQWIFECHANVLKEQEATIFYGYLSLDEESNRYFHDINTGKRCPLIVGDGFKRKDLLEEGMAVQVYRKSANDPAYLNYCYPIVERLDHSHHKRSRKKTAADKEPRTDKLTNEKAKQWAERLKVTVIGNRQVKDFSDELKRYVRKIDLIDAYERGEKALFGTIRASDYLFVCIDSVPHAVTDFIKNDEELVRKTHFFHHPAKSDGVARLNYIYWSEN
ncbi:MULTISPECIES: hypothetical protein [unclassified Enterococcus]|uniref:hypothetical protein n=1 Tax=unclassified Enterococcus TaxID=2608891 RepID=UPI0013EB8DA5|nr:MULTISPECIES: hypothetical protein [unclassified Enterococcus]